MVDTHTLNFKPKSWESVIGGHEDRRKFAYMYASSVLGKGRDKFYIKDISDPLEDCTAWIYILRAYEKSDHKYKILGDWPNPIGEIMQQPKGEKPPYGVAGLHDDGQFDIRLYPGATAFDDLWGRSILGGAIPTTVSIDVEGVQLGDGDHVFHWGTDEYPFWQPIISFRITAEVQIPGLR